MISLAPAHVLAQNRQEIGILPASYFMSAGFGDPSPFDNTPARWYTFFDLVQVLCVAVLWPMPWLCQRVECRGQRAR